jgi:hypothetical protein
MELEAQREENRDRKVIQTPHNSQLMTLVHKENHFSDLIQIPSFIA